MKQEKVKDYRPNYPKKLLKGTVLAAAALVAFGTAGCESTPAGGTPEPVPTEELVLDGEVGFEVPTEEPMLEGEPTVEEPDDRFIRVEEPALMGKIIVPETTPEP
jgi:hypothetical protein